ncbi:hypothetical protein GGR58DRAFT_382397 [Xylaria digitata]|nr:hypothetical protein GGR58DRAFT_382397 [Xylaria digitata]
MAEVLGAVIAGAQALDYALQLCETIEKTLNATSNQKRYHQTSQELIGILQLIRSNPHLHTPEIISCTQELIGIADKLCSTLCQRRRNCFMASIAFAIKQKKYDDIFTCLEQRKATLALCISQLNANTLGKLSNTSDRILFKVSSFYEKSTPSPSSTYCSQISDTSDYQQEKYIDDPGPFDTNIHTSPQANEHSGTRDRTLQEKYLPSARQEDCPPSIPGLEGPKEHILYEASDSSPGEEGRERQAKLPRTQHAGRPNTKQTRSPDYLTSAPKIKFEGNIQRGDSFQIVGIEIGPNSRVTDAELMALTSGITARNNVHVGKGTQVIGQRVHPGAKPRTFSGLYCSNTHRGAGGQIIGFSFE